MKRFKSTLVAICAIFIFSSTEAVLSGDGVLESGEADTLVSLWDFSKLKRDIFTTADEYWNEPVLINFAADEQRHGEILEDLIGFYGVEKPIYYWGNYSVLWYSEELKPILTMPGPWNFSRSEYFHVSAFLEEMNIRDLRDAISRTDEQLLIDTYADLIAESYAHLRKIASLLFEDPLDYSAQLLSQENTDLILTESIVQPSFEINAGLNDAWFDPATAGQGFFISVYEEQGMVFISWFTFDTVLPGQDVTANLGDAGQRWFTAQGNYVGAQADLVVYSSSAGLFNVAPPIPLGEPIGTIFLQFEDCNSGLVNFELPTIGEAGVIPIQRIALDNMAICEVQSHPAR